MNKTTLYLIVLFIFGLLLRLISASNTGYMPDDSSHAVYAINFLNSGKLEIYSQASSLWYSITDLFFKLFGVGHFPARLPAVLFGTFAILAMFLFTKEVFNEKAGLISAFLLAISPFILKFTISESDPMVLFLLLMSAFFFVKATKNDNNLMFYSISGVFLGLGVITKMYPVLFGIVFAIFGLYQNHRLRKRIFDKKIIKGLILFSVIAFIFVIPVLTHNYLLYKDKGIADFLFTNTLGIGIEKGAQYYSWDAGWGKSHEWLGFFLGNSESLGIKMPTSIYGMSFLLFSDLIVFILGAIGLVYCFFKKREFFILFLLGFIFVFAYLVTIIPLAKHFIFLLLFFIPPASFILSKIKYKVLIIILIAILLFNLIFLGFGGNLPTPQHFYGKSAEAKVMDFNKQIGENSLIVVDSRIYRGKISWMFYGKSYLEALHFLQVMDDPSLIPGEPQSIDVYYVECVTDDCGWGTVKKQPDFNASMEGLTNWFKENGALISEFDEPERYEAYYPFFKNKVTEMAVYSAKITMNSGIIEIASSPKEWYLYTIGYYGEQFDDYTVNGIFDKSLDLFAHLIIYLSMALAFLSCGYVVYLVLRRENEE